MGRRWAEAAIVHFEIVNNFRKNAPAAVAVQMTPSVDATKRGDRCGRSVGRSVGRQMALLDARPVAG